MKIDLILPTFNNEQLTINCIESINNLVENNQEINIIWIDNNSSNESRNIVLNKFLQLSNITFTKIFLSENLGFIKAVNIALNFLLKKDESEFIGILNNDIEVGEHWLSELINTLQSDEKIVCAGSIQFSGKKDNGVINLADLNYSDELKKIIGTSFLEIQKNISNYDFKESFLTFDFSNFSDYLFKNHYIAYYSVLFKPFIFKEIGLLNENFHLGYSDDTEFNFRITKAGYKIAKCFKSIVFHNSRSTFKNVFNDNNFISKIQLANNLQLKISKSLNKDHQKKYVIYTVITEQYDNLKTLSIYDHDNYDYVCFTDSKNIVNSNNKDWIIFDISLIKDVLNVDKVKVARYFKTHPHLFFENYEKSVWIDANIDIINDINKYVNLLDNDNYILCYNHPYRDCIYQEFDACIKFKKDTLDNIENLKKFLIHENYPEHNGLIQSNVLVRKHNDKKCIYLMEKWWEMIKNYSKRDQLSFNYIFWKNNGKYLTFPHSVVLKKFFTTNYLHNEG